MNKGAVAVIGNSATVYLNYNIAAVTGNEDPFALFSYEEMGLYDALMHPEVITIGGVMNVEREAIHRVSTGSETFTMLHLYALNLLGDPSLSPFLGIPEPIFVMHDDFDVSSDSFEVITEPGAYVALTDDIGNLIGATRADEDGIALIDLTPINSTSINLTVTAKWRIPYFEIIDLNPIGIDENIIYEISQLNIYPNPYKNNNVMRNNMKIDFNLLEASSLSIDIYNMRGQKVKHFEKKKFNSGRNCISWDTKDDRKDFLRSGIYFCKIKSSNFSVAKKILVID